MPGAFDQNKTPRYNHSQSYTLLKTQTCCSPCCGTWEPSEQVGAGPLGCRVLHKTSLTFMHHGHCVSLWVCMCVVHALCKPPRKAPLFKRHVGLQTLKICCLISFLQIIVSHTGNFLPGILCEALISCRWMRTSWYPIFRQNQTEDALVMCKYLGEIKQDYFI